MRVYVYDYHTLEDGRTIVNGVRYKKQGDKYSPVPCSYCSSDFTNLVPEFVVPTVLEVSFDKKDNKFKCKGFYK